MFGFRFSKRFRVCRFRNSCFLSFLVSVRMNFRVHAGFPFSVFKLSSGEKGVQPFGVFVYELISV